MAYFDHDDSFYSVSTAPEDFDSNPFLESRMLTTMDEAYRRAAPALAGIWATVGQPGSSATSSTSLLETGYGE